MISFLRGEIAEITESSVVLDCNGIGYEIIVPETVRSQLPSIGTSIKLHTYLQVREDGVSLFGFADREELSVFKLLISVNGIGPKGAVGILSAIDVDTLRFAVLSDDEKTIAKAPGIGAKTAKKLILELKDKFKLQDTFEHSIAASLTATPTDKSATRAIISDTVQALVALGFTSTDANKAINSIEITDDMTADDLIKVALKQLV